MSGIKVDQRLINKIVALRITGMKQENIAAECGVTQGTVSRVLRESGHGGRISRETAKPPAR